MLILCHFYGIANSEMFQDPDWQVSCRMFHINDHLKYNQTKDPFKLISNSRTYFELSLREGLLTKNMKPSLNAMESINLKVF